MRGEATFLAASGETRTLSFGNREFCLIEEEFDLPFAQVAAQLDGDNFRFIKFRKLFRIGLTRAQPGVTPEDASDLIDDLGTEAAVAMVVDCIRTALPQKKAGAKGEEPAAA